jgi:hypothetical protein
MRILLSDFQRIWMIDENGTDAFRGNAATH